MNTVVFKNSGLIDLRAIKTFGVSAKVNANPIGFFGTGLKYAIAILMRENVGLEMFVGKERYKFTTEPAEMRGKEFKVIKMNDVELPFTTELGKNWKMWQAFRELYCNTMDEKGDTFLSHGHITPEEGCTHFLVNGQEFLDVYARKDEYFLNIDERLLIHDGSIKIYDKESTSLFYRGIRVGDLTKPSKFTFNFIEQLELTEDRTVSNQYFSQMRMVGQLMMIKDKAKIKQAITSPDTTLEGNFDYNNTFICGYSDEFFETIGEEYRANNDYLVNSALEFYLKRMKQKGSKSYDPAPLSDIEKMQITRAMDTIEKVFPDAKDYEIMVVKNLGDQTMGLADRDKGKIVISKKCFHFGTKFLTSTIIEEYMHLKTGYGDHTRQLQTHLFDTICTIIEEHVIGEPL